MKYGLEKNHGKIIAITSYLNKGKKQADHYIASAKNCGGIWDGLALWQQAQIYKIC